MSEIQDCFWSRGLCRILPWRLDNYISGIVVMSQHNYGLDDGFWCVINTLTRRMPHGKCYVAYLDTFLFSSWQFADIIMRILAMLCASNIAARAPNAQNFSAPLTWATVGGPDVALDFICCFLPLIHKSLFSEMKVVCPHRPAPVRQRVLNGRAIRAFSLRMELNFIACVRPKLSGMNALFTETSL